MKISVLNRDGHASVVVQTTLGPGKEEVARAFAPDQPRYCKFEVDGTKANFRGSVLIRQPEAGAISALPAN